MRLQLQALYESNPTEKWHFQAPSRNKTQITPKENSPELGLLEDRLRLSTEITNTKFNKHRGRDHSTMGASHCTQSKDAQTINAKYRRKRVT